jgi:murein DD-endopeptidase MepM/ murein hydrolase activator NlpD
MSKNRIMFFIAIFIALLSGCSSPSEADEEAALTSTAEVEGGLPAQTAEPTPTSTATEIPATPTVDIQTIFCGEVFCQAQWDGLLERPIGTEYVNVIDATYPFAGTRDGTLDPHHGVEFVNEQGTPVLAAQSGEVVFAGEDYQLVLGPYAGFYGNVIVLRHPGLYEGRDMYTLYAHLSVINVEEGALVNTGEVIGEVGMTGIATGTHLHFEVRLEVNDYDHNTNPVMWFAPVMDDAGGQASTLAGIITTQDGTPVALYPLTLERLEEDDEVIGYYYPVTYYPFGLNAHPVLGENFTVSDLPPGDYRLSFIDGKLYEIRFTLEAGQLGFINFKLD